MPAVTPSDATEIKAMISRFEQSVNRNFDILGGQVDSVSNRVQSLEVRATTLETRAAKNSDRASALQGLTTEEDLALKASLANEMTARKTLEEKVDEVQRTNNEQNQAIAAVITSQARLMSIGSKLEKIIDAPSFKKAGAVFLFLLLSIASNVAATRYGVHIPLPGAPSPPTIVTVVTAPPPPPAPLPPPSSSVAP